MGLGLTNGDHLHSLRLRERVCDIACEDNGSDGLMNSLQDIIAESESFLTSDLRRCPFRCD